MLGRDEPLRAAAMRSRGVGPGVEAALAAGFDDAEACGVEAASLVCACAVADAARDHGVTERTFGVVVGGRQAGVVDEGDHRVPVVEDFVGQVPHLLLDLMSVALAVPLDGVHQSPDGFAVGLAVTDPLDQATQIADEVATEAGTVAVDPPASARPLRIRCARQR